MRRLILASVALILLVAPAAASADFPKPTGAVNDFAGVIQPQARAKLETLLTAVQQKTGVAVVVATVPSLDERPIEDYAVDLYKTWGIGQKGVDEGALILVAPNERRVRIEVGYGLEGALNDAQAGRLIRDLMIPYFKQKDFTRGIIAGTQGVVAVALKEKGVSPKELGAVAVEQAPSAAKKGGPLSIIGKIIVLLIMGYLFIRHPWLFLFFLASAGRGGGGGRSGFSGGFGGFGGGLSGGGGASGRW